MSTTSVGSLSGVHNYTIFKNTFSRLRFFLLICDSIYDFFSGLFCTCVGNIARSVYLQMGKIGKGNNLMLNFVHDSFLALSIFARVKLIPLLLRTVGEVPEIDNIDKR